jgi:hypothetical protein
MNHSTKNILGIFNPYGAIIEESISAKTFNDALGYFFELENTPNGRLVTTGLKSADQRSNISDALLIEYLYSLRTWQHELAHFYQIPSSPLGVFLNRSTLSKNAAIQRQFIEMQTTNWIVSGNNIYLPLIDWHHWLSKNCPFDDITNIVGNVVRIWNNTTTFEATMFWNHITDIADAIDDIQRLQGFTTSMLNQYFDVPSDIKLPSISSRLDKSMGCVPTPYCTTLKIIEAYARLNDLQLLTHLQVDERIVESVLSQETSDDVYYGVVDYIKYLYPNADISTILGIMDLSLFTPVDSLFHEFWSSELFWEDLHPGFRLRQIATLANEKSLQVEDEKFLDFYDKISNELRWPPSTLMLERMATLHLVDRFLGEASQLFTNKIAGLKRSASDFYMFELVRNLSNARLSHQGFPRHPYLTLVNSGELIEPFLNIVGDDIIIGNSLGIAQADLLGSSLQHYVFLDLFNNTFLGLTKKICSNLVRGSYNVSDPAEMEKMLIEGWLFLPYQRIRPIADLLP